ncbi:MAG: YbaK/EbsC family protein [Candidatus Gracilibacteria bacterium]|nr:YbaK/EbsC family protein [Candidatus Gracilibacteria bacterium]MDD2909166.1 YbaK/EbsC family protein [Candidatus Gracilibacteria bacterium]
MFQNYQNIKNILENLNITFNEIEHLESHSCNDSKKYRSELGLNGLGSKNIVFHCKGNFYLVTTHGDKSIKARNFKREFGSKDIRFASQDEINSIGLGTIGSISPFGFDNTLIPVFVDTEIFENEYFIFNPFVPTKSIQIKSEDLKRIYENMANNVKFFRHSEEEFEILEKLN